ncbi:transcriptional regulator [Pseudomonas mosselii]|uniref:transcriptional regulator n=1 Tax=Pseudomonas mosselii TaxID=78327 RepID=UPI001E37BF74|nr:YdaS family helix-turn-helix protein [Pseudomonas mosselii]MCL8299596.1 helix-turn-helix domain-containing protein [Pseudomonas mosselii]WJR31405.1 YdaS family helix-turn-helix protein [Pseudomonas mosselii]
MAVRAAGGQSALARLIKCTPQHIQKMCATGHVPACRVVSIESATGVARHHLRPDLYPEAPPTLNEKIRPITTQHSSTAAAVNSSSTAQVSP